MRVIYLAVALIAVVAGAGTIRANVGGADARSADPQDVLLGRNGLRATLAGERTADFGKSSGRTRLRQNGLRVAEVTSPANTGNPSLPPLKWVGMLKNPTPTKDQPGLYQYCTGQFITPNVVLTAGHCIKDLPDNPATTGYDLSKQSFSLQYQNGQSSQVFKTICAATPAQYALPANFKSLSGQQQNLAMLGLIQHDIGMILVNGTSPTGVMPYALDWKGKVTEAFAVGYVGDILDGEIVQQTPGYVFFADAIPILPQSFPNMILHWSPLTDFLSDGGAWIVNASTAEGSNNNILVAVTSLALTAYPGSETAAYLTAAEFNPLLKFVSNGCK